MILAFSGGLDTCFCAAWLKAQGFDVITVTVDTGGFKKGELQDINTKSKELGASKHILVNAKTYFYNKIISYSIKGNLLKGGSYPLCVGPERVIQAMKIVEIAQIEKARFIAHGSTGAGNDQIRFDLAIRAIAPGIKILVPVRDLGVSRDYELDFLKKVDIKFDTSKNYSINIGLLGTTIGGKETKNSWDSPPDGVYSVKSILKTPGRSENIKIKFRHGLPIFGLSLMTKLNILGTEHGVGRGIHLGTTILGIKGRVAYAAPGIAILIKAHEELEKLVMTARQLFWKGILGQVYANLLHEGMYFDPVMRDIERFIDSSQERVTGEVSVELIKGNIFIKGSKSPFSLMDQTVATYGEENNLWDGRDAEGFAKIYGMESCLWSKKNEN